MRSGLCSPRPEWDPFRARGDYVCEQEVKAVALYTQLSCTCLVLTFPVEAWACPHPRGHPASPVWLWGGLGGRKPPEGGGLGGFAPEGTRPSRARRHGRGSLSRSHVGQRLSRGSPAAPWHVAAACHGVAHRAPEQRRDATQPGVGRVVPLRLVLSMLVPFYHGVAHRGMDSTGATDTTGQSERGGRG